MCKISVIVPVYNVAPYLPKCLDSICNQTLKDIEIICVNDCSTDNSLEILKEYAQNDTRIKLIDFKENKGVSAARNAGIKTAQGEYIGFVDSDDWIDLNFYEKLYEYAIRTHCDVAKSEMIIVSTNCNISKLPTYRNNMIKQNRLNFYYEFYTAIYNKKFLINNNIYFPEDVLTFEDPVFSIQVILSDPKLELISGTNYYLLERNNSKTKTFELYKINSFITGAQQIINLLNSYNINKKDYITIYEDLIFFDFIGRHIKAHISIEQCFKNYNKLYNSLDFNYKPYRCLNCTELNNLYNKLKQKIYIKKLSHSVRRPTNV